MDAAAQIQDRDRLWNDDGPWRNTMAQLSPLVRPVREEIRGKLVAGARRSRDCYDATGIIANQNLGSAVYGSASNPADIWFTLGTDDPDFDKWPKARSAFAAYSRRTLASFGPSWSSFYAQTFPFYLDTTGLGTGQFYSALRFDRAGVVDGFTDTCIPLSEAVYRLDGDGCCSHFYRQWEVTLAEAAAMAKKRGGTLSDASKIKLEQNPQHVIILQHSVWLNEDYQPGRLGPSGKPFTSCYLEVDQKHEISRSGFDEMPFFVSPWERAAGERRGRGAGEIALANLLSLQVMQRDNITAGAWQANPFWGTPHNQNLDFTRLRPGGIMPGAISMQGSELIKRMGGAGSGGSPFSTEMTSDLRQAIRDAFEGAITSVVQPNRTGMTPTEVLDVREERFRRMAPYQGNVTAYFLSPIVMRHFNLLQRQGVFADVLPPKEIAKRTIRPKFQSPMALASAAAQASSAVRAFGAIAQAAELDPSVADRFNGDRYAQKVFAGYGVADILNNDDETASRAQTRQQAQQMQQSAELADTAAGAAQKGAGAVAALRGPQAGG